MQTQAMGSRELLTARQVQELLHIDRSTVYRMAGDGRLTSIRVGRQLRFPADQLGGLLGGTAAAGQDGLDPAVCEATIQVMAELLGVAMVITDMAGRPITPIANPAGWLAEDGQGAEGCLEQWRALADDADLAPRFVASPDGCQCARAFIRSGTALVGMLLVGGIAAPGAVPPQRADRFHHLDETQRADVLRALPRIAAALGARVCTTPQEMKESQ